MYLWIGYRKWILGVREYYCYLMLFFYVFLIIYRKSMQRYTRKGHFCKYFGYLLGFTWVFSAISVILVNI